MSKNNSSDSNSPDKIESCLEDLKDLGLIKSFRRTDDDDIFRYEREFPREFLEDLRFNAASEQTQVLSLFLSYARKDQKLVHYVADSLKKRGVDLWLDTWQIKPGASVSSSLEKGIKNSKLLAVWLSKNSVVSKWVDVEWRTKYIQEVEDEEIYVIPLLAEECEIPLFLRDKQYIDFRSNIDSGVGELLDLLGVLNKEETERQVAEFVPIILELLGRSSRGQIPELVHGIGWLDHKFRRRVSSLALIQLIEDRKIKYSFELGTLQLA